MGEFEALKAKLGDKWRRLTSGKLYFIKDKRGQKVPFLPNNAQLQFYHAKIKHPLIVIPKARQRGLTTAQQIWMLDEFLWRRNRSGGVIADNKENAMDIFNNKIKYARDNFPSRLKFDEKGVPRRVMDTDRANQLSCQNTFSRLRVSTTFRGGTLQELHVSEFAKICADRPKAAKEIVTGAFESVAQGQRIVIESTSRGNEGYFFDIAKKAQEIADSGREPNAMEYKLLFFPRWEEETYVSDTNAPLPEEMVEYFEKLEEEENIVLTMPQKMWYASKWEMQSDDMFKEYPSTFDECFAMILEGTYYEKQLKSARRNQRICKVDYDENLEVHTARDLGGAGGGDDMTIVFFQVYGKEIRFIDCWEGNGVSLVRTIENVIKKKPYHYGKMFAPHDIMVTELSYGESRWDAAAKVGCRFEVIPRGAKLSNDIEVVRNMFTRCWFDETKCSLLLTRLSNYRRKWNDSVGTFMDEPMKNGAQHMADGFRYAMLGVYDGTREVEKAEVSSLKT